MKILVCWGNLSQIKTSCWSAGITLAGFLICMQVSELIIEQAKEEGWEMSLAFAVRVKAKYRKGIVYYYTCRKLAAVLNKSHEFVRKHVKELYKQGLVSTDGKSLYFHKLSNEKHKSTIDTNLCTHLKNITKLFSLKLLEKNARQQAHVIKRKRKYRDIKGDMLKPDVKLTTKSIRYVNKHIGDKKIDAVIYNNIVLSNKAFGNLIGCTPKTVIVIKDWLRLNKQLDYSSEVKRVTQSVAAKTKDKKKYFWFNGCIFTKLPTKYVFKEY